MYQNSQQPQDRRSVPMTTAAIVLSAIAVSTVCCVYLSFICGIMGIIFALLSKGGEQTMSRNAKMALWVSCAAVVLSAVLLAGAFFAMLVQYGSLEAFWEAYQEMMEAYSSMLPPVE